MMRIPLSVCCFLWLFVAMTAHAQQLRHTQTAKRQLTANQTRCKSIGVCLKSYHAPINNTMIVLKKLKVTRDLLRATSIQLQAHILALSLANKAP